MLLLYLHNSVYWFRLSDLKFFFAFGLLLSITGLLLLGSFSTLSTYLIRHLLIMQTRGPDCFFLGSYITKREKEPKRREASKVIHSKCKLGQFRLLAASRFLL